MVTMTLNEHTADDYKSIQELKSMGVPDETIQTAYNNTQAKREAVDWKERFVSRFGRCE